MRADDGHGGEDAGSTVERALVCGWPSLPGGEATAGDLLTMQWVAQALIDAGLEVDVATNLGFPGGVDATAVPPERYDHLVFVCGPLHGAQVVALAERFPSANRVAVNVSVVDPALVRRFHHVIARDDGDTVRADLSFAQPTTDVPVVGVVRAHPQPEYPAADHERVHDVVRLALASRDCATVDFDTRVHPAADPLAAHARSSAAVSALAARMDVVVSTRLHGAVLALARGTPVVAVDPIAGGAKLAAQMDAIGWPVQRAETVTSEQVAQRLEWCLSEEARRLAAQVAADSRPVADSVRHQLLTAVGPAGTDHQGQHRRA